MKRMVKFTESLLLAAAFVLCIAPCCENGLRGESSFPAGSDSKTVRRAMLKSIQWATDQEILRLVKRAEKKYGNQIDEISKKYCTSPTDIKAITVVESLVDEEAESGESAIGLMGVKRTTGMAMGFTDIKHPIRNLNAGTKYYKALLNKFKDRELAFAAYNLGPGKLEKRLNHHFDPETIGYVWKIRRVVHIINKSELPPKA